MSAPTHLTVDELANALRAQAKGYYSSEASVGVLISHESWLYRRDFRRFIDYTDDPDLVGDDGPMAKVQWKRVVTAINTNRLAASQSEIQILMVAAGLAGHGKWSLKDMVDSLDNINLATVLHGLAHLGGWHESGRRVPIDGTFGGAR